MPTLQGGCPSLRMPQVLIVSTRQRARHRTTQRLGTDASDHIEVRSSGVHVLSPSRRNVKPTQSTNCRGVRCRPPSIHFQTSIQHLGYVESDQGDSPCDEGSDYKPRMTMQVSRPRYSPASCSTARKMAGRTIRFWNLVCHPLRIISGFRPLADEQSPNDSQLCLAK